MSEGRDSRPPFLLCTESPRRVALLEAAGIAFERGPAPGVDETPAAGLSPADAALEIAVRKALAAARRAPGRTVLTADTVVVLGDRILGKPDGRVGAVGMLKALSGRTHRVVTGVASARGRACAGAVDEAEVEFRPLATAEIEAYVAGGEPLGKAGAYAIQGGAAGFVVRLLGAKDTVMGLPVALALSIVEGCDRLAATADEEESGLLRP